MTNRQTVTTGWSKQIVNMRFAAITMVILGHSIILYSSEWNLYSTVYKVVSLDYLKKIIDIIQMPLFFSISGFLFWKTMRKVTFFSLVQNKIKRLLIPYVITGFLYMLPIKLFVGYKGYQDKKFQEIIVDFILGRDVGHLWFLQALFWIFIIAWCIVKCVRILPFINKYESIALFVFSLFLYLEGYRIPYVYDSIKAALGNIIWFSMGYMFCEFQNIIEKFYSKDQIRYIVIFTCIVCTILYVFGNANVFVQIYCKCSWILNLYNLMPEKESQVVNIISKDSFGIYLFHSPLIYITYTLWANINPFLVVSINVVFWGGIALILTEILRKLKLSFILGEYK